LELSRRLSQSQLETATVQAEKDDVPLAALPELISQLEDQMKTCAQDLKFEEAARLRDRIRTLRQKLVGSS
ncbi:MAG: excinuclease ABC subunit B, partial [Synechococcus sp. SB0673_bin_10]|nr:excinuclease ABC subunit B [Synechococcus sp. SB0673_bin_10]